MKNKGFVIIETIVTVVILTTSLLYLYNSYSTIINREDPKQYRLTDFSDDIMDEKKSKEKLEEMKNLMSPEQDLEVLRTYAPRISRLQDLIDKLTTTNGWDAHLIQEKDDGEYRIYHQYVNYRKDGDIEYRVGIYVKEKGSNNS